MFLSDRDLAWAIETGRLTVEPKPKKIDPTSIDLHLGKIEDAVVWDIDKFTKEMRASGNRPELHVGQYSVAEFAPKFTRAPPDYQLDSDSKVMRRGDQVVVKPLGFVLWMTEEVVGTPKNNADLICFVEGKSTKARTGMVVHLTAPIIHSTWTGNVVLEIVNLGPFDIVFHAGDAIAQLTVCRITSSPYKGMEGTSATYGQTHVSGQRGPSQAP